MAPYKAKIVGTGSYLPEELISNEQLSQQVGVSSEWIFERTGIRVRHKASPTESTTDLAVQAATQALQMAGLKSSSLDMILFATATPDHVMPNAAARLQHKLQAGPPCGAMDISAACSGFLYAMAVASDFIAAGSYKNILVVGAEVLTPFVDYSDRDTAILFGDGAGALVMSQATPESESFVYGHAMDSDGSRGELIQMLGFAPQYGQPARDKEAKSLKLNNICMNGREVFRLAVRTMSEEGRQMLSRHKLPPEQVDWLIPHQANVRILDAVAKHAGIDKNKVVVELEDTGNTSAATVGIALDRAVRDARVQRGQNILFTVFGAGLTSGTLLLKY